MKKFAISALSTEGVVGKDEGDFVRFPASFAAEGIFTDPEGHKGYRSRAEVEKMVPFMNGLRVVVNHPDLTGEGITAATLADKEFPVIGWTENAKFDIKDNTARVIGDICVSKVDRAGNDRTPLIAKMNEGKSKNVSIGYFYDHVPATGEFHGVTYDHIEKDVNPYHLAILTPDRQPQAAPPICGIGCNHAEPGKCSGCSHSQKEVTEMGDDDKDKEKQTPPSIAEMNLNALIGQNAEVKGLAEQKAALEAKLKELDGQVKALNAKTEKGDEAMKALGKIKAEERKTKVDRIKAVYDEEELKELFPDDTLDKIGEDELTRHLRVVDILAKEETEEPAAPAPPMARSSKELKVPAGKNAPASGENEDDRFLPNLFQAPRAPGRKALETQED